jgi:transposase
LAGWLKTEAGKSRKQRRTLKQLHADLVALGFTGSYGRVAAFARNWRADRQREQQTTGRGTFVPLSFRPGEAFQFDWSEDFAVLGGERAKLQMAHIKLAHSRAFLLRAFPLQTHEMLFDAHWHAFRVFGGVPGRGIYDIGPWCRRWSEAHGVGARRWIVSAAARNGRSTSASSP